MKAYLVLSLGRTIRKVKENEGVGQRPVEEGGEGSAETERPLGSSLIARAARSSVP